MYSNSPTQRCSVIRISSPETTSSPVHSTPDPVEAELAHTGPAEGVSHTSRVGGVKVRWLRKREECLRNHQMGCLCVCNRMRSSSTEGVVNLFASPGHCGLAPQLSPSCSCAGRPLRALTLWNSLAASR